MPFQHVAPVLIDRLASPVQAVRLQRITNSDAVTGTAYLETLIQSLVDLDPTILPVEEIEPAFVGLRPICQELPVGPAGAERYVDNLLINRDGRVCLVECKLWRNRESIREVVGQLLAYASLLAGMSYDDLVSAVRKVVGQTGDDPVADRVLGPDAGEDDRADFAERVTRSLRKGTFLLLILGDRIRPEVQRIADLLQDHATLDFTFSLIEMAIYGTPEGTGPYYVQPRILARTVTVTRTVFLTAADRTTPVITRVQPAGKPATISEQEFFHELASVDRTYPDRVRALLDRCRAIGCQPKLLRRYVLYVDDPLGGRINLGSIAKDGTVEFWGNAGRDRLYGEPVGRAYMNRLASLLPGAHVKDEFESPGSWYVRYRDRGAIPLSEMLIREDQWLAAMRDVAEQFRSLERRKEAKLAASQSVG